MITRHWGIYLPELTDLDKIEINKNSCAYSLLIADQGHESIWYTFNYTNPWYLCQLSKEAKPVFIHNETVPLDRAKHHGLCHFIPMNLIFGVGQSFGITDSDYFKPYFYGIIEGKIKRQNIFIVTYNEESFTNIYSNMQEYGIKIEDINKANVDVHLVYTIKGSQSMEFMQMLTTLYGCYFKN